MSTIYALVVLLNVLLAIASSAPPRPLTRIAHPTTLALEILPRHNTLKRRSSTSSPFLSSPNLLHSDSFRLTVSAFNETFHLHLRPNDHLIHPAARINYFKDGALDRTVPLVRESVRAYWGEVVSASRTQQRLREDAAGMWPQPELGWARIVVHSQGDAERGVAPVFEGAFSVRGVTHNVQTRANYIRKRQVLDPDLEEVVSPDGQLVIWRDSDVVREESEDRVLGCLHDPWRSPVPHMPWDDSWANKSIARRDDVQGSGSSNNFESNIGQTTGCPTTQKILYMGAAADCSYVSAHGSTQAATTQIINNWNTASSLYKSTFNVSLGLIQIDVQEAECPSTAPSDAPWNVGCDSSVTLNDRLSLFSGWRGDKGNDGAGLWHLMSGCPTGSEVGVAWLGTLCQQKTTGSTGSFVSGTAVSTNGRTEWEVVSHEIGHNFGAIHDCQSGCGTSSSSSTVCCPLSGSSCDANDDFIMSPVTSSSQKKFSDCSLGNICSVMLSTSSSAVNATCLQDPSSAITTLSLNMCGNGIVESGEDCDPGQNNTSTCCDASTCRFTNNAVCDPANSACCTDSCAFASAGTVCRPAADAMCDVAESCTGSSADCPADAFEPNGMSCGSEGGDSLACANGVCTSLNQQCRIVGASLNLTTACTNQDNSCRVSCEDPNNPSQCVQLQSQLIDGSSCGYGGTCESGTCKAGSAADVVKAWYVQNLQISIPVTIVVAIVALFIVWAIFICCKRTCAKKKAKAARSMEPAFSGQRGARLSSWQGPPAPITTAYNLGRSASGGGGGGGGGVPPPVVPFASRPPPPAATATATGGRRSGSGSMGSAEGMMRGMGTGPGPGPGASEPPSSFVRNVAPPTTMSSRNSRNQSWDGVYGVPAPAPPPPPRNGNGSAGSVVNPFVGNTNAARRNDNRGSGEENGGGERRSRAREPAFPSMSGTMGRSRTNGNGNGNGNGNEANWVDPAKWNGPLR